MSKMDKQVKDLLELEGNTALVSLELRLRIITEYLLASQKEKPMANFLSLVERIICEEAVKIKGSKYKAAKALGIDLKTIRIRLTGNKP